MKMLRKTVNGSEKGTTMAARKRCDKCGLYMCSHLRNGIPAHDELPILSLASQSGTTKLLADLEEEEARSKRHAHPRIRVASSKEDDDTLYNLNHTSIIPMKSTVGAEAERVIIPPPPKVPVITSARTVKDRWVNCSICKARVHIDFLTQHERVHVDMHRPTANSSSTTASTSSAIVKHMPLVHSPPPAQENKPKLSPVERYTFRAIDTACAASSMSQDSRYSDFTIILWLKEKLAVSSGHYSGSSGYSTSKDAERLSVHVVYDSLEDYYTLTTKLLKRSSYSTYDSEENVPDRICLSTKEVNDEIKRAFLFFCVSPRAAYKHFRKLFKQELSIDYDTANRACIAQTANCDTLFERLKRPAETWTGRDYCGMG